MGLRNPTLCCNFALYERKGEREREREREREGERERERERESKLMINVPGK